MTPKERHFEFMKAAIENIQDLQHGHLYECAKDACLFADAALAEFERRWPEDVTSPGKKLPEPDFRPGKGKEWRS